MAEEVNLYGDIHGDFSWIAKKMQRKPVMSILLGDVGIGFPEGAYVRNPVTKTKEFVFKEENGQKIYDQLPIIDNLFFIRGNHDNRSICCQHPYYLGDYGYINRLDLFYISGAFSIDKIYRTEGVDWWNDEQLSLEDLRKAVQLYESIKPAYVISHDAPSKIVECLFPNTIKLRNRNRTQQALDVMWSKCNWQPKRWIFGHYHISRTKTVENTRASCVGIRQKYVLTI